MIIGILSDLHLGYGWETEREEDSFVQAREALERVAAKADIIIIPGDIFDARNPRQEVLHRALNLFSRFKFDAAVRTKLVDLKTARGERLDWKARQGAAATGGELSYSVGTISLHATHELGIPIVAIHGTHDRRARSATNPVKLLEEAGHLIHLDGQTAIFEKDGERVAICGVAGVPEVYSRERFKELKPKPVSGAINIMMLHQSIKGFVYMDEDNPTLTLEDMPRNFDLIVNGHIHWGGRAQIGITDVLIAGSTITTQVRKGEATISKKVYFYETKTKQISEEVLQTPRPVFYFELKADGKTATQVRAEVLAALQSVTDKELPKKPLVRVRIVGKSTETLGSFSDVVAEFTDKLLLTVKDDSSSDEQLQKLEKARGFLEGGLDIESMGLRVLSELSAKEQFSFKTADVFELLADGDIEKAEEQLTKGPAEKPAAAEPSKPVDVVLPWNAPGAPKKGQATLFG